MGKQEKDEGRCVRKCTKRKASKPLIKFSF